MNKINFINIINSYLNKIIINDYNSCSYVSKLLINDYLNSVIYSTDLKELNRLKDLILNVLADSYGIVLTIPEITL